MKRKAIIALAAVAYLALGALFLFGYRGYLRRPAQGVWDDVQGYLLGEGHYAGEPVEASPSWLVNYAKDWGRFRGVHFKGSDDDPVYWSFSTTRESPSGYDVAAERAFPGVIVQKFVRRSNGP
jgi:hypothetical protein